MLLSPQTPPPIETSASGATAVTRLTPWERWQAFPPLSSLPPSLSATMTVAVAAASSHLLLCRGAGAVGGRALTPRLPRLLPTRAATPARRPARPLTEVVPRPCQGGRAVPTAHTPDAPSSARQASLDRSSASGGTQDGPPPPPGSHTSIPPPQPTLPHTLPSTCERGCNRQAPAVAASFAATLATGSGGGGEGRCGASAPINGRSATPLPLRRCCRGPNVRAVETAALLSTSRTLAATPLDAPPA